MAKTLAQLRRENAMLKSRRKDNSNLLKEQIERRELMHEQRELKYPKTYKTARTIKKLGGGALRRIGTRTGEFVKQQYNIGAVEKKRQLETQQKKIRESIRKKIFADIRKKKPIVKTKVKRRRRR